jgi:aspartate ammonia-lyase
MAMKYRTETDFLGERKIPAHAYYGINAMRGAENFHIGEDKNDAALIKTVAWVKKACALANSDCAELDENIANAICLACDKIADGGYNDQFIVHPIQGGGGTSFNMAANEIIANLSLEILGYEKGAYAKIGPLTHINMSQSTNDVFPTALNLALLLKLDPLLKTIGSAQKTVSAKAQELGTAEKMGRTHLNAAAPIGFGQCFDVYASVLARDHEQIKNAAGGLRFVPLGGTVIGTGLNASPQYRERVIGRLRQISGIDIEARLNLADGIHNVDMYVTLSSALKNCMLNLSKLASDLRLSGSEPRHGFGELRLPPRQTGSSVITEKVNPVMAELINQVSFLVCGYDSSISMAAQAGQLELNVYKPIISYCLFRSIDRMTESISLFERFCLKELRCVI